ncbi:MAG: SDR family NAD(P)-dependent oxidoreductase [Novosphingobium sp.]|nr:SDR family NAD(P)-dependent oxidoreductase [Novosphingobium sp.]
MAGELSGKVAIVTGASQGTGRAYARALAQAGATVIATSRSMKMPEPGEEFVPNTLAELGEVARQAGEDIHLIACDVGNEDQIIRCVEQVMANFGRIDVIVSNAATYPEDQPSPHYDPLGFTTEEWERYNRINVVGPYLMIREVAPHMIAQKSGSIINITSGASLGVEVAAAQFGMLAYVTTKAALNRLSQFYALEFKDHNIAVNAICPGSVVTHSWRGVPQEMQDEMLARGTGKLPTTEAMGPSIVCLAQQDASGITGQILHTDDHGVSWP